MNHCSGTMPIGCCCRDDWDADELGIDPDAKWFDIEHQGILLGPGQLEQLPQLPQPGKPANA